MTTMYRSNHQRSVMRRAFVTTAIFVLLTMRPGPAQAQSFDCRAARYPDQLTICQDSRLARLDQQLATLYRREAGTLAPDQLEQFQRHEIFFLNARRRCGENNRCLEQSYRNRIQELQNLQRSGERTETGDAVSSTDEPSDRRDSRKTVSPRRPEPSGSTGIERLIEASGSSTTPERPPEASAGARIERKIEPSADTAKEPAGEQKTAPRRPEQRAKPSRTTTTVTTETQTAPVVAATPAPQASATAAPAGPMIRWADPPPAR
jgi:uncharacterized protein